MLPLCLQKKEDKERREAACFENAFFLHSIEHTPSSRALLLSAVLLLTEVVVVKKTRLPLLLSNFNTFRFYTLSLL